MLQTGFSAFILYIVCKIMTPLHEQKTLVERTDVSIVNAACAPELLWNPEPLTTPS